MVVAHSAKARWLLEDPSNKETGHLVQCPQCDLLYFDQVFTTSQLDSMYSGYRGPVYFQRRNKFEPWYTQKLNDAIGHSNVVLDLRQEHLRNFLQEEIKFGSIASPSRVLDVGGDEGQFIPNLESISDRAVLEVSGVKPVENVSTISTWEEAAEFRPDMVMMCHVLEHTDEARKMCSDASRLLSTGGLLYVEIPLDRPKKIGSVFSKNFYGAYTKFLAGHPVAFRVADLLSLVSRRLFGQPIIGSVMKQNEHINYFNRSSLNKVICSMGYEEVRSSVYKPSSGVPILDVEALGVLYKKS